MRKILFLLGPVVATVALLACEDSGSGGSSGIFTTDSPSFEGSVPAEAGPQPDAAVDAPVLPTTVTVSVVRGAGPAAGITVVFHDAAGAVTETKTTGADGKATSTAGLLPAQASVLLGTANQPHTLTWTTVQAGDELLVRDPGDYGSSAYDVTTQGNFTDGGAAGLTASIGNCTGYSATSPITVFTNADCRRPTTAILARAFAPGAPSTDPLAYAFAKGKAAQPADGGAGAAAVGPWLTPITATITPKNLPAQSASSAVLFELADGLGIENPTGALNRISGATTFKVAPGFADAQQAALRVFPNLTPGASLTIAKRGAPAANTDIDFASPLPTLAGVVAVTTTAARPQVDWSTVGGASLNATDGGSVFVSWSDPRQESSGSWTFIVAPNAKTITAPVLPASAAAWAPHGPNDAGSGVNFDPPTVVFVEGDILPDYSAFRRQAGLVLPLTNVSNPDARAILPANGTIKLTAFTQPLVR